MFKQIAVLIPTYKRASRLQSLIDNFTKTSKDSELYFVVHPKDTETIKTLDQLSEGYFFNVLKNSGEYVECINYGVAKTKEPFIFCGADDIEFSNRWDIKLLGSFKDDKVNVTGGIDDWTCSRSGVHISHPLIRRKYIDEQGACFNNKGELYYSGYKHYQCDIEMEQVAWARNCFKLNKDVTIGHNHFVNKKADHDETYDRSFTVFKQDQDLFDSRKKYYEWWDTKMLHQGKAVRASDFKRLSVIMPIWNCEDYTRKTIDSLLKNTLHPYELILIDDNSTEFNGKELLADLEKQAREKFLIVKTIANKEQKYCNANWNKGVELATGDYIAIINSDIEFETPEWDDYLMENIDLGYDLVNPFQSDHIYPGKPYQLPPPSDFLYRMNIRGACYMLSKEFAKKMFPIPERYIHWCGDNYLSRNAKTFMFDIRVSIYHYISRSGAKVDQKKFWKMVRQDALNWQEDSGEDFSEVINNCNKRLKQLGVK